MKCIVGLNRHTSMAACPKIREIAGGNRRLSGAALCCLFTGEADGDAGSSAHTHLFHPNNHTFAVNPHAAVGSRGNEGDAHLSTYGRLEIRLEEHSTIAEITNHPDVCSGDRWRLYLGGSMYEGSRTGARDLIIPSGKNHDELKAAPRRPRP